MIRYALKCAEGHSFESWFQSAEAFDTLKRSGHLTCAVCGSGDVSKAIMAPRVTAARDKVTEPKAPMPKPSAPEAPVPAPQPMAAAPADPKVQAALAEVKRQVEANSDYVGNNFAKEARAMHLGDAPERAIYGEAKPAEAKALIEDGVPVMPLPFMPTRKTN